MFIELIDSLRCTGDHEESWLVASADEMVGRHIRHGVLGCPVCRAQFPIVDFVTEFGPASPQPVVPWSDDEFLRLRALLSLGEPGGTVLLGSAWSGFARAIADLDVQVILLDPRSDATLGRGISGIRVGDRLPFAARALRAVALDDAARSESFLSSVAHALKAGGRVIAPVGSDAPVGLNMLARDDRQWVAESAAEVTSSPVSLRRR